MTRALWHSGTTWEPHNYVPAFRPTRGRRTKEFYEERELQDDTADLEKRCLSQKKPKLTYVFLKKEWCISKIWKQKLLLFQKRGPRKMIGGNTESTKHV